MMPTIEKVWGKLPEAAPVTGAVCIAVEMKQEACPPMKPSSPI
jgi:hypothetical protein